MKTNNIVKTYAQTINYMAQRKLSSYLGGGNGYGDYHGVGAIAFIYGKTENSVIKDINEDFEIVKLQHYAQFNRPAGLPRVAYLETFWS
jgi:hypothetical protein